jgi:hypothetical protein
MDNIYNKLSRLSGYRKRAIEENKKSYEQSSKDKLAQSIEKKMKTTFIGALSAMEEELGYLWGHNKNGKMTSEEREMKKVWDKIRNKVLNNGNHQYRLIEQELEQYSVNWDRYRTEINFERNETNSGGNNGQ